MRASELRGVPWPDVDLEAGIIHVRQQADAWSNIGPPKSKAGKRDIPLAPIVVNALKQWKDECPQGELDLVFPNGSGIVESLTNVWKRFWIPLQIDCRMVVDTENKDEQGNPYPPTSIWLPRPAARRGEPIYPVSELVAKEALQLPLCARLKENM